MNGTIAPRLFTHSEPAPPVINDVAALTRHRLGGMRVALERHADGIDRRDHLPLGKDAHETPEADTTAVLVGRLHIKIARALEWDRHEKVGQPRFGDLVEIKYYVLAVSEWVFTRAGPEAAIRLSYSITSSARARIEDGTIRPSALAVLRLTTSSKVVGCSTGRSAGLAPLRIFPA
jgi:hypothetical protein